MRLNPDCVRDVLLYLEENLVYINTNDSIIKHNELTIKQISKSVNELHGYEIDEINYAIEKLLETDFITASKYKEVADGGILLCCISNITWNGHQFLDNIRPKTIWEATKEKANKIGGMSISALAMISSSIIQGLASSPDFIQNIVNIINQMH